MMKTKKKNASLRSFYRFKKFSYFPCQTFNSYSSNSEKTSKENSHVFFTQKVHPMIQKKKTGEINPGDFLTLTVTSLISKKLGIAEFSDGSTIFLPETKLGDQVKAKIIRVISSPVGFHYAIGEVVQVLQESQIEAPVSIGEFFELTISEKGPKESGKVTFPNHYSLFIPNAILGEKVKVMITRVKIHYAFAKILEPNLQSISFLSKEKKEFTSNFSNNGLEFQSESKLMEGSQCTLVLPEKTVKTSNYFILNFKIKSTDSLFSDNPFLEEKKGKQKILLIKTGLGVERGDKIRIKMTKILQTSKKNSPLIVLAKILKISPISVFQKQQKIQRDLNKMLKNGMHFGELTCHAFMKKFLWSKKKSSHSLLKQKFFKKKDRHILNLLKTRRCLKKSFKQLAKYAAFGRTFLFVGTKKPAAGLIARAALLSQNSFFVNTRWLGGMLTNWKTLLKSISKIQPILREKQKILYHLLQKRHSIKKRLIKKINKLRSQSQQLLKKGKLFVTKMKKERTQALEKSLKNSVSQEKRETPFFSSEILMTKREKYLQKGRIFLNKYQKLSNQKSLITHSFQVFENKASQFLLLKKKLLKEYQRRTKKLHQFNLLLTLSHELQILNHSFKKEKEMKKMFTVSSGTQLKMQLNDQTSPWSVPNPPREIIQKILKTLQESNQIGNFSKNEEVFERKKNSQEKTETVFNQAVLLSKFLNKFSHLAFFSKEKKGNFLKNSIKTLKSRIHHQKRLLLEIQENLSNIQRKMVFCLNSKKKILTEIHLIENQLILSKKIFKNLNKKFQIFSSSQKLLKFLPRLRYLSTSKRKILETVQIFMKKFVDPKLRYPMEKIYEEKLKYQSKKRAATRQQKWQRLEKYFGGITSMAKLKNQQIRKNIVILIGQQEEMNAIFECKKLGIKMFHLVDTNCNPRLADYLIPSNDDSRNSIQFVLTQLLAHIRLAQQIRKKIILSV